MPSVIFWKLLRSLLTLPDGKEPSGAIMENTMVPRSQQAPSRDVVRSFDLPSRPSQPQSGHKLPIHKNDSVPFFPYSSSRVMKKGPAAESSKTSKHTILLNPH